MHKTVFIGPCRSILQLTSHDIPLQMILQENMLVISIRRCLSLATNDMLVAIRRNQVIGHNTHNDNNSRIQYVKKLFFNMKIVLK